jgi:hypothetical protein
MQMSISFASVSSSASSLVVSKHPLRRMAKGLPFITDEQLDEVQALIPFDKYFDEDKYELSGHFILTKDEDLWHNEVDRMCCGIIAYPETLSNGEIVYFAFDYGH